MYSLNLKLSRMCSWNKFSLFFFLLDSIVMQHVFIWTCLQCLWCLQLRQMNKAWFMVVGSCLPWNALEVMKIDHTSNTLPLMVPLGSHSKRDLNLNFKLWRRVWIPIDLIYPTLYDSKNDSLNVTLCSVEQTSLLNPCIFPQFSNFKWAQILYKVEWKLLHLFTMYVID